MRLRTLTIAALVLSMLSVYVIATYIEQGDTNAASMYLVVFSAPLAFLIMLNGLFLSFLRRQKRRLIKVIGGVFPVITLLYLSYLDDLTIKSVDGNLVFVARIGAIAIGIMNLIWLVSILKEKEIDFDDWPRRV
jgi:drug/metabolite transporter superfamily protein YnfA